MTKNDSTYRMYTQDSVDTCRRMNIKEMAYMAPPFQESLEIHVNIIPSRLIIVQAIILNEDGEIPVC